MQNDVEGEGEMPRRAGKRKKEEKEDGLATEVRRQ